MNVATKWKYDFYFGVYNKLFGLKWGGDRRGGRSGFVDKFRKLEAIFLTY